MKYDRRFIFFEAVLLMLVLLLSGVGNRLRADTSGNCSGQTITLPFNDVVGSAFFCQIAAAFFSGLTSGTTATTYSPTNTVTREQMAAFITRTLDQSLKRGSRRAALQMFWTTKTTLGLGGTLAGSALRLPASDGADVWVASAGDDTVARVRASDGRKLETWTNAFQAYGVAVGNGRIFVTGKTSPGRLYEIEADKAPGAVRQIEGLPTDPEGVAFDGRLVWTANVSGSVSRISVTPQNPTVHTFTNNFVSPRGILHDGANIWVTDSGDNRLKKLDENGNVLLSVPVGNTPRHPAFDGTNIWVPNFGSHSVTVVRAATGAVLATLTDNGLNAPLGVAFDGERIAVTNHGSESGISLWRATALTPIEHIAVTNPGFPGFGICSDGLRFWVTVGQKLAYF
jgi:hypothetical protein